MGSALVRFTDYSKHSERHNFSILHDGEAGHRPKALGFDRQHLWERLGAGPLAAKWLEGLIAQRDAVGYMLKDNVEEESYIGLLALRIGGTHATLDSIFSNLDLRAIFEREFLRGAPTITNRQRALDSVKAIGRHFSPSDAISILIVGCGIMPHVGSPIVNKLSEAFPNSMIDATDISFSHMPFKRLPNAEFREYDVLLQPLPENTSHVVHCTNLLLYFAEEPREMALRKLVGAVKDGGLLVTDKECVPKALEIAASLGKNISARHLTF
ncbi:MAG: class I SAM-dependent methyltransferase [Candidatus Micrarchaeia archaeon]